MMFTGSLLASAHSPGMWRVVFFERRGKRIYMNRTAPWHAQEAHARAWAQWFHERGHNVALEDHTGAMQRLSPGLPS